MIQAVHTDRAREILTLSSASALLRPDIGTPNVGKDALLELSAISQTHSHIAVGDRVGMDWELVTRQEHDWLGHLYGTLRLGKWVALLISDGMDY